MTNFDLLEFEAYALELRKDGTEAGTSSVNFVMPARKHGLRFGVSDHLWMSYKMVRGKPYERQGRPDGGRGLRRR